jgi:HAD superfamily hydrolase (TIGR01509 family)
VTAAATTPPALEAVIFDCDGVLFDSTAANIAFYDAILKTLGEPPLGPEHHERAIAHASPQVLAALFANDPARHAVATRIAERIEYGPFFELMVPAPGLHRLLAALRGRYRLAMATNRGKTIPELLRAFDLEDAFDAVVGFLDVPRPKPHPDMLLECARRLDFACASAVYVGDSHGDLVAATAAGMRFIAVGNRCEHSVRISHLGELERALVDVTGAPAATR